MKSLSRGLIVAGLTIVLAQCSGQQTPTDAPGTSAVRGARMAVEWTWQATRVLLSMQRIRPAPMLGIYATDYLIHTSMFRSAYAGIEAQLALLFDEDAEQSESFALLEELGTILQVDVPDMLNRSDGRSRAFDTYVESLQEIGERATNHKEGLEQEEEDIRDERRTQRRATADIQRALNTALREQDYGSASSLQQQLIEAETELAGIESREDEQRSIIRLFENLLEIAEERLTAMTANREALIAGVKVIELPGVDDLGILEQGRRSRRRGSGFDRSLIDPSL